MAAARRAGIIAETAAAAHLGVTDSGGRCAAGGGRGRRLLWETGAVNQGASWHPGVLMADRLRLPFTSEPMHFFHGCMLLTRTAPDTQSSTHTL